jgi:hypothetical protein
MISGSEVKLDIQGFAEWLKEVWNELWALVGSDMRGDTMFQEDIDQEQSH